MSTYTISNIDKASNTITVTSTPASSTRNYITNDAAYAFPVHTYYQGKALFSPYAEFFKVLFALDIVKEDKLRWGFVTYTSNWPTITFPPGYAVKI
jgi:hypothetical protein